MISEPGRENPVAAFTFADGGYIKEEARDLVIIDKSGKKVPYKVIWCEPGWKTTFIFPAASKGQKYSVYYGNPFAMESTSFRWDPKVSLTLETSKNPGGEIDDFKNMRVLLKRIKKVYGRGFVDKIWHGLNPYGPDDNYISVYRGYLKIEKEGIYEIATASDEASFIFIDGELVTEWPGYHSVRGGLYGEYSGPVLLNAGLHKITYYHMERGGAQFMMAAWKKPGQKKFEIIPAAFYLHPAQSEELSYRRTNQNFTACFTAVQKSEMIKGDVQYTRVDFKNCSYDSKKRKISYMWDFGDGMKSSEEIPSHIYNQVKHYRVTLTVRARDEKDIFKFLIKIRRSVGNIAPADKKCLDDYAGIVDMYQHDELSRDELFSYIGLFENIDEKKYLISICDVYLRKYEQYSREKTTQVMRILAGAYESVDLGKSLKLYAGLSKRETDKDLLYMAEKARADIYLYELKDYGRAIKMYKLIVNRFPYNKDGVKLARIGIGDVYREKGEYDRAGEIYAGIEKEAAGDTGIEKTVMERGIYAGRVESFLNQGRLKEALDELTQWQLHFPASKLSGEFILLYAEYLYRKGNYKRAISELTKLAEIDPKSPFLKDAKILIEKAEKASGTF